jgi:hypothetical protein
MVYSASKLTRKGRKLFADGKGFFCGAAGCYQHFFQKKVFGKQKKFTCAADSF